MANNELSTVNNYGNIWVRELLFLETGDVKTGHYHNFDHIHFVARGKVKVTINDPENKAIVEVHSAPAWLKVPKEIYHSVEALEDMSLCYCIEALRDEDGVIVDTNFAAEADGKKECTYVVPEGLK